MSKAFSSITAVIFVCAGVLPVSGCLFAERSVWVIDQKDRIGIYNDFQKIEFIRNASGGYELKTYIRTDTWEEMFNSALPIIQGENFSNLPTEAKVTKDSAGEAAIELSGRNEAAEYDYKIVVEASGASPLIHFTISSNLERSILVKENEPKIMLWMDRQPEDLVTVYQEVPSYQWVGDEQWNSCFPMAYVWTGGLESGIFFNIGAMDWFSFKLGVERFHNMQVRTTAAEGRTGIGFDIRKAIPSGKRIKEGAMIVDFYLYGRANPTAPARMDALGIAVDAFGECFPSDVSWASDQISPDQELTYQNVMNKTIEQLMLEDITYKITPFYKVLQSQQGQWQDNPAFGENTVDNMIRRPSYAVGGALNPASNGKYDVINSGNWNTNNNTLIPWIGVERLYPDTAQKALIDIGYNGLKAYYDSVAQLIRSFESADNYIGNGVEFSFQNFLMGMETLQASEYRGPAEYDPAVAGKFLMGLAGSMGVARTNGYLFPQLFYAGTKEASVSLDEPRLGETTDVWTMAIYAYQMCMAYDFTKDEQYLEEAKKSTEYLFSGVQFTASNSVFTTTYTDPYDFPMNDVASSAWGVAAAQFLYRTTKDAKYLKYSDYFRNITLRLMVWFESSLRDDPKDQFIRSAGLMHVSPAAGTPCPWESIYSYMPMLLELKNTDVGVPALLLNMFNQFRVNNFYFSGAAWDPSVISSAKYYQQHPANYLMSEDFYQAETQTSMGTWGPCVYMSNNVFYAYYMYEAFLSASDRDVMALGLDIVDGVSEMMEGIERNFLVYNPASVSKKTVLKFKHLNEGDYTITITRSGEKVRTYTRSARQLQNGLNIRLDAGEYVNITATSSDKVMVSAYYKAIEAQRKISMLYQKIQTAAADGTGSDVDRMKESYYQALELYTDKNYDQAIITAEE